MTMVMIKKMMMIGDDNDNDDDDDRSEDTDCWHHVHFKWSIYYISESDLLDLTAS